MLTCGACGTDNPAGHRFCGACGSALATVCPSCGTPAAPGFRFCGACGTPLDAASTPSTPTPDAAPVSERRVCSILFADLVGFTPLSEFRDAEEVRELLSRYFDEARTIIARYGGTVEKFIGDAVMAVWGTPVVLEGDAERAVRAALELVAAVSALGLEVGAPGLAARGGVVTGEVAVTIGAVGEGMVAGDAVNTAARVQAAADPGTVFVDPATQRLAGQLIGFDDAGRHQLKGKAEPVTLWRAVRVLTSVGGERRVDGLEAAMIGRDAEDRTLRELFHACADRRMARVVTVTGEAGIGKSRLALEFEKYIDGLAGAAFWHRGRCLSYGDGVAYWALAEAVRQRLGIAEDDSVDTASARFLAALEEFVPDPEHRAFIGVRLGRLIGLVHPDDTGAELGAPELFAGWRLFFERLAEDDPVIVLIEDAQHADDGLLDFIEHVVDWARNSPVYILLFARPELLENRPGLGSGRNRSSLSLDPLDRRSVGTLLASLVQDLPDAAVAAIAAQAEGNPLFVIETIRSLIDRDLIVASDGHYRLVGDIGDIGVLAVPETLRGLLAARLDTLDPGPRRLVADAAVLGTSFPATALATIAGLPVDEVTATLTALVRRGIFEVSTDPFSPDRGFYVFGQNMLRQVAYGTLSRRDRRARHIAVADHLQTVSVGGGDEFMDVIAAHYLDALEAVPGDVDTEVRAKALDSLIRAADRSDRAGARVRAARSLQRAAGLLEDGVADEDGDGDGTRTSAGQLYERAAASFGAATHYDDAIAACMQARTIFLAAGQQRSAARAMAAEGRWRRRAGRLSEATPLLEQALTTLRTDPDVDTVRALSEAAICATYTEDTYRLELVQETMRLGQSLDIPDSLMCELLIMRGLSDLLDRRLVEATAVMRHAVELAGRAGARAQLGTALSNLSAIEICLDFAAATRSARAAREEGRLAGEQLMVEIATFNIVTSLLCNGAWDEAIAEAERAAEQGEASFATAAHAIVLALRGDTAHATELAALPELRASEDPDEAMLAGWVDAVLAYTAGRPDETLAILRATLSGHVDYTLEGVFWSWPLAVRCAFVVDDLTAVDELVAQLDALPGYLPPMVRSARSLARAGLAAAGGAPDPEVTAAFEEAVSALRSAGSPYHLAHGLLDFADHVRGTDGDATTLLAEASSINDSLRARDLVERLAAVSALSAVAEVPVPR